MIDMAAGATNNGLERLRQLFRSEVDAFVADNNGLRLNHKHLIGAAMWAWLIDTGRVDARLQAQGQAIHHDQKTGPAGHPLWRFAFRKTVRGDVRLDRLFDGKRVGPTPLYARLAEQGLLPADPSELVRPRRGDERPVEGASRRDFETVDRYRAKQEWMVGDSGDEWLYIFTTVRELSLHAQQGVIPALKIGSSRKHYAERIAEQRGSTAANSTLVCLHAYRVNDSRAVERSVHRHLKADGLHVVDAPGVEWFIATPETVHALVEDFAGPAQPVVQ